MDKIARIIVSLLLPIFLIAPSYGQDKIISLSSEEWKDATQQDGVGLYWDIFRAVYEPEGYHIEYKIRSYEGSVNHLKNNSSDVMIGSYADEIEDVVYPENHFAVDVVQVIYPKNRQIQWNGVETIRRRGVAWIKGYSYDDYLPERVSNDINIRRLNSRDAGFILMRQGKIDFFMDASSDLTDYLSMSNKYQADDYLREDILELNLYPVFSNTEEGRKLAEIYDRRFSALLVNGKIGEMYAKYTGFTYPSDF